MEKKAQPGRWKIKTILFSCCLAIAIIFMVVNSCGPKDPVVPVPTTSTSATSGPLTPPKAHVDAPNFNMDTAFSFVKYQCDLGPRNPGSKAHEKCAQWLEKKLKSYGAEVIVQESTVQTFDEKKWICKNIIGAFNPEARERVLLCAHWDTRPFADHDSLERNKTLPIIGANDGASGVGVLLEVARALSQKKTTVGIDIIFFDMEDYGESKTEESWCLGTQYWGKNLHTPQYFAKYGVLLDMVGGKGAVFPKEGSSAYYAADVQNKIWNTAQLMGYSNYFSNTKTNMTMDDHIYVNTLAGIPCIDIVQYNAEKNSYFPFHHKMADNLDCIDKNTLGTIGKVLLEVIYNE